MVGMGLSNENKNWGWIFFLVMGSIIFMVLILAYVLCVFDPSIETICFWM